MNEFIEILIAKFPNPEAAESALKQLNKEREKENIQFADAAVVRRAQDGKLRIHETHDVSSGRGATVGGILGGILGILAGPAGFVAGAAAGAVVGGAAARLIDLGIPHNRLEEIGSGLEPKHAALVILTDAEDAELIQSAIRAEDVEFHLETMNAQAAHELGREHEVALKALTLGEALADGGMASANNSE